MFHFWGGEYGAGVGWLDANTRWCGGSLGLQRAAAAPSGMRFGSREWRAGR